MLAEEQARQGHWVAVLTTNAGTTAADGVVADERTMRHGVEVCYCARKPGFGIKSPSLEQAVRDRVGEFDILHISAIWHPVARAAHSAAHRHGVPVIVSPRGALGPYAWRRRRLLKIAYYFVFERAHFKAAAGFHLTSEKEATESTPYLFDRPYRIVPNGIDEQRWRRDEPAGRAWRVAHGIAKDDWLLLYVGRLHHKKGLEVLPAAIAEAQRSVRNQALRLVLVGPNEDETLQRLENGAWQQLPAACLRWVPTLPEAALPAIYSAADVFLMPSLHENFGNSAIEALACGCRVLVSADTGCYEFARECGMAAVGSHSPAAWAGAILRAVRDGRRQVGSREREQLLARIGLPVTATTMIGFYAEILASRFRSHG
jgi:glycosyltransferase involved in cell wall biosynthesis